MHGMQPLHAVHAVAFLSLSSVKSMLLQTFLQKLQTLHLHLQEKYRQQQQEQQEELGCHIIMIPFCLATWLIQDRTFQLMQLRCKSVNLICACLLSAVKYTFNFMHAHVLYEFVYISPVTRMAHLASISHIHVCASLVLVNKPLAKPRSKGCWL